MLTPFLFLSLIAATAQEAPAVAPTATVPAGSGAPNATVPAGAATGKPGDDKVTCETQTETGSRLASHKVCLTRAQWRERAFQDRMEAQSRQHRWNNGGGG